MEELGIIPIYRGMTNLGMKFNCENGCKYRTRKAGCDFESRGINPQMHETCQIFARNRQHHPKQSHAMSW
jgi:hypothetical protein